MKLKYFTIVTLLIIGILPTLGKDWYYSRIQLQCEPAGAGLVYASTSTASTSNCTSTTYTGVYGRTANSNYYPCPWNIYTKPVDPTKYKFLYWECMLRVGDILSYSSWDWSSWSTVSHSATAVGTQYTTASVEGSIYAGLSLAGVADNDGSIDYGIVNAIWVAHYEELEHHDVTVSSNDNTLGSVSVTGPDGTAENQVGDIVTITARTENHRVKFLGWKLNGEWVRNNDGNILREVPYTFTVTEQNRGEYIAYFEGGHDFVRIKNRNTGHYISAQEYFSGSSSQGLIGLQTALSTFTLNDDLDASLDDQGSVILWTSYPRPNTVDQTVNVMEIRGASTEPYYTVSNGVFLYMSHNADNSYDIGNGGNSSFHIVEYNGKIRGSNTATSNMNYLWNFEGMDLDLTTKENYYTPDQLIQGENGLWYGTHRASWNTKYDSNQITAYIITGVTNGVLQKTEVTGGIIPAGTAVLLECKTNDRTLNVMIPTLENASFTPTGNILTSCEIYFPDQDVSTSDNYKALTITDGNIGFGGNALSKVDGNHGYLQITDDALINSKIPNITLAELIASGDTQRTYNVTDLTSVEVVNGDRLLICKDDNGYATKDVRSDEEYIDFMHTIASGSGLSSTVPSTYDQSNWIGVRLPGDAEFTASALLGKPLKGVTGKLVNTVNPEFVLDKNSLEINAEGIAAKTDLNPYIAASFYGQNLQTSSVNNKVYFFVQPKPMELANVEWAQWNGEKFLVPVANEANPTWNDANLQGEFEFNGSYLEQGGVFLETGHCYEMLPAIIKAKDGNNYPHVYVLGDVNDQGWSPQKGVEMYTSDGNIYTATVTVNNVDNGYGYFSFTKKLAGRNEWDDIKDYRFGAEAEGANYYVDPNYLGNELPLAYWSGDSRSFQLAQGTYRLMVNLSTLKLVITPAQAGVPGVKDGSNGYVVYPLQINKVTTEENGVITAINGVQSGKTVTRVVYYNLMGVESDKPHPGINIVETRYSDGTRTTTKIIR